MADNFLPILIFLAASTGLGVVMLLVGRIFGPRRKSAVKEMPYESGMDPVHAAARRFDIRFHLVAIAFLVFDVELLFLYPWATALKSDAGVQAAVDAGTISSRGFVFGGILVFVAMVVLGLIYDWRKGLFQWR